MLFSLTPLNLLDATQEREQGTHGSDPKLFVYSTVVVFVHPGQVLTTIQNAVGFFHQLYSAILHGGHSNGWCTLCQLPSYKTSGYFPVIPHLPCLVLPMSVPSTDLAIQTQLCLDIAGCDADHMIIWLLHYMWCHDKDYAMMLPALRSNLAVPWDLHMEEYPKLWQNAVYITRDVGSPGEKVSLAMTFVSTSCREFNTGWLVLDIADDRAIRYLALKVDDDEDGDGSTGDAVEDDNDENDSDEDELDEDLLKTVKDIANKTDDSGFRSTTEDNPKIKPLLGPGTTWMGNLPLYSLKVPVVNTQSGMSMASRGEEVAEASFDAFLNVHTDRSGISELTGGQALLQDCTSAAELSQLRELANEQVKITCSFDAKFSDTAFALQQKTHEAFLGTGGIAWKFVNDMATVGVNFI